LVVCLGLQSVRDTKILYPLKPGPVGTGTGTDQLEQVLPEVLSHQPEQRQVGPAERVVARVSVVRVSPSFQTHVPLWTDPETITIKIIFITIKIIFINIIIFINVPGIRAVSTEQSIKLTWLGVVVFYQTDIQTQTDRYTDRRI